MNYSTGSFVKVVLLYFTVISLVFLWSGSKKDKTIFDNYLIQFEGSSFNFEDENKTKLFYEDILELKIIKDLSNEIVFILPDNRKLIAYKTLDVSNSPKEIFIKVKNGIHKLHKKLEKRVQSHENIGSITAISKNNSITEFTLIDPSGNKVRFIS